MVASALFLPRVLRRTRSFLAIVAVLLLVGCRGDGDVRKSRALPVVVTTTTMLRDVAEQLNPGCYATLGLMAPGVDPHTYKATAGDLQRVQQASIVLFHGLNLEGKLAEVLVAYAVKRPQIVAVTRNLSPESLIVDGHFGIADPHVWFSVPLWRQVVREVHAVLAANFPDCASQINRRHDEYQARLASLDNDIRELLQAVPPPQRVLVTAHDAFSYFGREYGVFVRSLQGISTAAEFGVRDVENLADFVVERKIPAVFVESSVPPRFVEAVIAAVASRGRQVALGGSLFSDALGAPESGAATYEDMVRYNVKTIVHALLLG